MSNKIKCQQKEEKTKEMERSNCELLFGNKCRGGAKKNPEGNR